MLSVFSLQSVYLIFLITYEFVEDESEMNDSSSSSPIRRVNRSSTMPP